MTRALTEFNFHGKGNPMAKRTGRPPTVKKPANMTRYIPLIMKHGDVELVDRAADRAGLSRAEWVRRRLIGAAQRALA